VQPAKVFGAEVTGLCSTTKMEPVRSIGADHVIDHTRDDVADGTRCCDLIIDTAGNRSLSVLRRALTPGGNPRHRGIRRRGRWPQSTDRLFRAVTLSPFIGQDLGGLMSTASQEDREFLREIIETGKVTPVINRTYSLGEVPEVVRHLEEGHARGKVVITV
jgi:NADPH:quinone reductase-like Zn-dependent oxidoreductase